MPENLTPQKEVKENSEKPLHSLMSTHTHLTETHTTGQKSKRKKEGCIQFRNEP